MLVGEPVLPIGLVGIVNAGEELRRKHEVLPGDQVSVGDSERRPYDCVVSAEQHKVVVIVQGARDSGRSD